jgi:hypothetical protein
VSKENFLFRRYVASDNKRHFVAVWNADAFVSEDCQTVGGDLGVGFETDKALAVV